MSKHASEVHGGLLWKNLHWLQSLGTTSHLPTPLNPSEAKSQSSEHSAADATPLKDERSAQGLALHRRTSPGQVVDGEEQVKNTERLLVPPLQRRREETRRAGKIPPNAVRASDEEKRRAEGIG